MADGRATPVVPNDHNSHMAGPEAHPSPRPRVVVLWSAPRSLSTAVERVMIEARNLECLWQQIEWLSSAPFVSGAIRPRDPRVLRGTFLLGPRKGEATAHCPQWLSLESPGRWLPGECTSGVSTSRDESAPRAHVRRGSRAGVHIAAARGQSGSLLQRAGLLWCAQHTSAHASHPVADHVYPSALQHAAVPHALDLVLGASHADIQHAFLIRDPAKTVRSLDSTNRKSGLAFDAAEVGFTAMHTLLQRLEELPTARPPIILDADELVADPEKVRTVEIVDRKHSVKISLRRLARYSAASAAQWAFLSSLRCCTGRWAL